MQWRLYLSLARCQALAAHVLKPIGQLCIGAGQGSDVPQVECLHVDEKLLSVPARCTASEEAARGVRTSQDGLGAAAVMMHNEQSCTLVSHHREARCEDACACAQEVDKSTSGLDYAATPACSNKHRSCYFRRKELRTNGYQSGPNSASTRASPQKSLPSNEGRGTHSDTSKKLFHHQGDVLC
eukprot:6130138-Amphidinium_carterae.1